MCQKKGRSGKREEADERKPTNNLGL